MLLLDVNVWVYAHREETPGHLEYKRFVEHLLNAETPFGISTLVLSGFLRIVTHPKIFDPPSPLEDAFAFSNQIIRHPDGILVSPGDRHWAIFTNLCKHAEARGNLIPDAYLAALAIESESTWVTTDKDFSRFPGLDWKHPLKDF